VATFAAGDVVTLKSGGPYMAVSVIVQGSALGGVMPGDLECQWFDGPVLYKSIFHPQSLKSVQEPVAAPNDPED
jgi:uncharacterized protein YodC (DUF2158 family)